MTSSVFIKYNSDLRKGAYEQCHAAIAVVARSMTYDIQVTLVILYNRMVRVYFLTEAPLHAIDKSPTSDPLQLVFLLGTKPYSRIQARYHIYSL